MKKAFGMLVTLTAFAVVASPAKASLVQFANPLQAGCVTSEHCGQLVDLGALGFGNAPRMLTLQSDPTQVGASTPLEADFASGDAIAGANKTTVPTLGSLGWDPGEFVAIGYNLAQNSGGGPTLNQLTLNLYDASNVLQSSFSLASPTTYTEADRTLQQGNGNGVFVFVLDAAQRAAWNLLHPQDAWKVGLFANMGCAGTETATCQASNAGPDSFLAIAAGNPIINPNQGPGDVPLPAAVWMFGSGLVGLSILVRRRKRFRQAA